MISKPIDDIDLIAILGKLPPDGATIFTLEADSIRGALVSGTRMVNRMRANHGLGPVETLVLGQAYLAAGLLSTTIKGEDRITVRYDLTGPAQGFAVEASARGEVRGRLFHVPIEIADESGALEPSALFGPGSITVTRFLEGRSTPFTGQIDLRSGQSIAQGLASYFLNSEQTRTSFSLSVKFDRLGRAVGAGALYLQAMPGATDEALDRVERLALGLPSLGEFFAGGKSRADFATMAFPFFDLNLLGEANVEFFCGCTRERLGAFVFSLPADELDDIAENGPFPVEVTCHNCGSVYRFSQEEFRAIVASRTRQE